MIFKVDILWCIVAFIAGWFAAVAMAKPTINSQQIQWATSKCNLNGGINNVENWYFDSSQHWTYTTCNNGARFEMEHKK